MIHIIGVVLIFAVIGVLVYVRFHNSKVLDKFTHDLIHEDLHDFKETPDLINKAQQADEALNQRVDDNAKAVEQIEKDTESIKKHREEDTEAPKGGK